MTIQRMAIIESGYVVNVAVVDTESAWTPPPGMIAVQSDTAETGWSYEDEIFAPPVAPSLPFDEETLKQYRDQVIESEVLIFNEKKAVANARSREALSNAINYLLLQNNPATTINWKGPDGWYVCTLSDIQGLVMAGGAHVQKCFNAEKTVLENHALTPYDSWEDAKADFDTEMEA